jgi:hypothetical protein
VLIFVNRSSATAWREEAFRGGQLASDDPERDPAEPGERDPEGDPEDTNGSNDEGKEIAETAEQRRKRKQKKVLDVEDTSPSPNEDPADALYWRNGRVERLEAENASLRAEVECLKHPCRAVILDPQPVERQVTVTTQALASSFPMPTPEELDRLRDAVGRHFTSRGLVTNGVSSGTDNLWRASRLSAI